MIARLALVLSRSLLVAACLVAVATLGCVSIPTSPSPAESLDVPDEFATQQKSNKSVEVDLEQWWQDFGDEKLSELVRRGLDNNLDLRIAATRLEAAAAQARIAGADLKPQLNSSLASRRSKQNFIGFPIPGAEDRVLSSTSTSHGLALNASWEADLWGRLRAGKRAAVFDASAAEYDLAAARTSLAAQIAKLYFAHSEALQQMALDQKTLASRSETAERIDLRYERGLATPLDIRLAQAQVASIEASLAGNRQQAEVVTRQLEVLLADYPGGTLFGHSARSRSNTDSAQWSLPSELEPLPTGMPSELLLRRPDLRAAEQRALSAAQRVGQAKAALYPSFSLTASGGSSSQELENLLNSDFSVWSLATNLLQPLFQGGRLRAAIDANEAVHEQSLLQWIRLTLQAFSEVETQLVVEQLTAERQAALERNLEQAREAERLATDRYLAGLATYLDLLESQRQAFLAESQVITAKRQRVDARIDLILALGGGYKDPLPPTTSLSENDSDETGR